jgi:oxygen-independent coproporphyrinogen III oxidase
VSLGLYLHAPFCRALCSYCNFNRGLFDESLKRQYVAAVDAEVRRAGERPRAAADTVYFGGGTPSLLDPLEVAGLVDACRESFDLAADAEITLEANPETVDAERLDGFRRAGVNRLSFGVQSFDDEELDRLSRLHSAARAREAFTLARTVGFDNISLDLMMWLPGQTVESWLESVDELVALDPEHASLYLLELYPQAPLNGAMARAGWSQASDDAAAEMYGRAMARLEEAGYEQYEISNVARPGWRSRHNLKYWTDGEWLGFGCGAHSTRDGIRWKNVSETQAYVQRVAAGASVVAERHRLSAAERLGDAVFTGLRLNDGVQVEAIAERYSADIWQCYGEQLQPYLEAGLVRYDDGWLRLTRRGMLLAHEVMAVFV